MDSIYTIGIFLVVLDYISRRKKGWNFVRRKILQKKTANYEATVAQWKTKFDLFKLYFAWMKENQPVSLQPLSNYAILKQGGFVYN